MKRRKRFPATVMIDGTVNYVGCWMTAKDAAIARDRLRLYHSLRASTFEAEACMRGPASAEDLRLEALALARAHRPTPFTGVYWDGDRELWRADVADRKKHYATIGFFQDDREAAAVRDRVMVHIYGEKAVLNFPHERPEPLSLEAAPSEARSLRASHLCRRPHARPQTPRSAPIGCDRPAFAPPPHTSDCV